MKTMMNLWKGAMALMLMLPLALNTMAQDGGTIKKDLSVGDFNAIAHDQPFVMKISQGTTPAVTVQGPQATIENITAEVKDNTLTIKNKSNAWDNVMVYVVVKNISKIEVEGAAVLESTSEIKADNLELSAEGAADVSLQLQVNSLKTEASGAADLKLRGTAPLHTAEISGAASLKAMDLQTKTTAIEVSGAGDAKVDATEELKGEVSGAASLYNKSKPTTVNVEESGAGSIVTDTTKFRFGDKKVMIFNEDFPKGPGCQNNGRKKDKVNPQWAGLELGFSSLMTNDFGFALPTGYEYFEPTAGRSFNVGLNIFEIGIPIVKKHMTLVTGAGFEFSNFYFNNNYTMLSDTNVLAATEVPGTEFKTNKLMVSYFRIPLLLQFDSKKDKKGSTFHFSLGAIGAVRMSSHTKQLWEIDETKYRMVTKDDFNLSPFKADATVRIGYGYLNLFVNYSLNSMFKKGAGPQVFPVSAGITLVNI